MPDEERRIVYRAVADFGNLAAEAAKARQEIQALKDAEGKSHASSIQGVSALEAAHKRKTAAIKEETAEEGRARQSTAQHTAAMMADAKAVEQRGVAESRLAKTETESLARSARTTEARKAGLQLTEREAAVLRQLADARQKYESLNQKYSQAGGVSGASHKLVEDLSNAGSAYKKLERDASSVIAKQKLVEFEQSRLAKEAAQKAESLGWSGGFQGKLPKPLSQGPSPFVGDLAATWAGMHKGKVYIPLGLQIPKDSDIKSEVDKISKKLENYTSGAWQVGTGRPAQAQGVRETIFPVATKAARDVAQAFKVPSFSQDVLGSEAADKVREEGAKKLEESQHRVRSTFAATEASAIRYQSALIGLAKAQNVYGVASTEALSAERRLDNARISSERAIGNLNSAQKTFLDVQRSIGKEANKAYAEVLKGKTDAERVGLSFKALGITASATFKDMRSASREAVAGLEDSASTFTRIGTAIGAAFTAGTQGANKFSGASTVLKGIGSLFESIGGFVDKAIQQVSTFAIGFTALGPVVSIVAALGSAVLGLAGGLGSLAGSVAALPGLIAAGASAFGALALAISPVIAAIKDYAAVSQASQQAAFDPQVQQQNIQKQQALQQSIWGVASALNAQKNAEFELRNAQGSVTRAQVSLNEAVVTARRNLEDLQEAVTNAALAQKGASLSLQQAQVAYRRSLADPNATLLDRQEALLRVQEAQVSLNDVNKQAQRNQQDLSVAQQKGVSGSDAVVAAQSALRDALHGVVTAQEAMLQAQQGSIKAQQAYNNALFAAQQPTAGVQTSMSKLAVAMANLSPSAQTFVKSFSGFTSVFRDISKQVQESFFSRIIGQIGNLKSLVPTITNLFSKAGAALGNVTAKGIAMVSSGPWKADFATGAKANAVVIQNLGTAGLSVADAFRNIAVAAIPFVTWMSKGIANVADEFAKWSARERGNGGIASFLDRLEPRIKLVGDIFKNIFKTIFGLGAAAMPFNDWLLKGLDNITKGWADNAKKQEDAGSKFKTFLEGVKPILHELGKTVHEIASEFGNLAGDPNSQSGALHFLQELNDKWLPKIFDWINQVNKTGLFKSMVDSLSFVFKAIDDFWKEGGGGFVTGFLNTLAAILEIISKLGFAAPVLGALGIGLGIIGALRFTGVFKLVRAIMWLKKAGTIGNIFKGIWDKVTGGGGASTSNTQTAAAEKTGSIWTTAADKVAQTWMAAADKVSAALTRGGATARDEMSAGGGAASRDMAAGGGAASRDMSVGGTAAGRDLEIGGANARTDIATGGTVAGRDMATGGATSRDEMSAGGGFARDEMSAGGGFARDKMTVGGAAASKDMAAGGATAESEMRAGGTGVGPAGTNTSKSGGFFSALGKLFAGAFIGYQTAQAGQSALEAPSTNPNQTAQPTIPGALGAVGGGAAGGALFGPLGAIAGAIAGFVEFAQTHPNRYITGQAVPAPSGPGPSGAVPAGPTPAPVYGPRTPAHAAPDLQPMGPTSAPGFGPRGPRGPDTYIGSLNTLWDKAVKGLPPLFETNVHGPQGRFFNTFRKNIDSNTKDLPPLANSSIHGAKGHFFDTFRKNIDSNTNDLPSLANNNIHGAKGHFFDTFRKNIDSNTKDLPPLANNSIHGAKGHFFDTFKKNIDSNTNDLPSLANNSIHGAKGHFFDTFKGNLDSNTKDLPSQFVNAVYGPQGHFFGTFQNKFAYITNGLSSLFDKTVPPAVNNFFNGLTNSFKLPAPLPGNLPVLNGLPPWPRHAAGGTVADGLSTVGEQGFEFLYKQGSHVDVIPAGKMPGFALGTDFGSALSRLPQFSPAVHSGAHLSSLGSTNKSGIAIDKLEINNPKPEPAGDSLYRSLQKIQYYAGRGGKW